MQKWERVSSDVQMSVLSLLSETTQANGLLYPHASRWLSLPGPIRTQATGSLSRGGGGGGDSVGPVRGGRGGGVGDWRGKR
jgi:hypothetical protein